ncbi:hypothetical protein CCHL11_00742 [Colletotrichum chlorophyti]|uniref:Uncharacterized protein n=1 Tax=Colletotrichum chlorophyti TaxID=708187 RepID=A0A1Q8S4J8_9PEZI|nr:hypothetical protein CCHL11_00742 [Colletotrichum chlorophyti]
MKLQYLTVVPFFTVQALAGCGPNQVELWDLHVFDGTAQCSDYGCYKACPGVDGEGSCNGCRSQGGPNSLTLGASYCCDGPIQGLTNTCVTGCPSTVLPSHQLK